MYTHTHINTFNIYTHTFTQGNIINTKNQLIYKCRQIDIQPKYMQTDITLGTSRQRQLSTDKASLRLMKGPTTKGDLLSKDV